MITVTIDGRKIVLEKPVTILDAARTVGIRIPTLCNNDLLESFGGCRLCLVEVDKVPRLQTACTQYVTDGMVVWTETDRVAEARRGILEFLLINHPLDCPYCDKAGECELQDLVARYGPTAGRFAEGKRKNAESFEDPVIVRNMERCILCTQCVRMCGDVQGASAICMTNRGSRSLMEPFSGGRYDCEYCGNCLTVCPVGAITAQAERHVFRPWLIEKEVETVCSHCGVGCALVLQMRGKSIVRNVPRTGLGLNNGLLCGRGRFGYDYIADGRRLERPLIRKKEGRQTAGWEEALSFVAQRLKTIKAKHGGEAIAGIASGRCTNEEMYLFQKFLRGVIGSNSIGSVAGLAYGPAQKFLDRIFGQGSTANQIHGIAVSDGVFVIGGDPTSVNPVLGLEIRSAARKGVPIVVIGHAPGLRRFADYELIPKSHTEPALLAGLVSEILKRRPLPGERPSFEKILKGLSPVAPGDASVVTGIGENDIVAAAEALSKVSNPSVILGRNVVQTNHGQANLFFLAALIYLLNGKVYLLSESPNEQGLLDMGCQPDIFPPERHQRTGTLRKECEEALGVEIPVTPGLGYLKIIEGARSGRIKALYVMDENVLTSLPDTSFVREALGNLEFLVVQGSFRTETTEIADAVLPMAAWAERDGSYTNLERRIQFTRKAKDGKGRDGWRILAGISRILGFETAYRDAADIFAEIGNAWLPYRDLTVVDVKNGKWLLPYKGGPAHDAGIEGIEPPDIDAVMKGADRGKVFAHRESALFHPRGSIRYSAALAAISPEPRVRMNRALAERLAVGKGDSVTVSTNRGSITLSAEIDPSLPEDVVMIPDREEDGILGIIKWRVVAGIPVLDGAEVRIEKVQKKEGS